MSERVPVGLCSWVGSDLRHERNGVIAVWAWASSQ